MDRTGQVPSDTDVVIIEDRFPGIFGREVEAKRRLNGTSKVNRWTDKHTDRQTDISTDFFLGWLPSVWCTF